VILIWHTICIGSAVCLPYQTYLSAFLRDGLGCALGAALLLAVILFLPPERPTSAP